MPILKSSSRKNITDAWKRSQTMLATIGPKDKGLGQPKRLSPFQTRATSVPPIPSIQTVGLRLDPASGSPSLTLIDDPSTETVANCLVLSLSHVANETQFPIWRCAQTMVFNSCTQCSVVGLPTRNTDVESVTHTVMGKGV